MALLRLINDHLGVAAGIIASLLVIIPPTRAGMVRAWKGVVVMARAPWILVRMETGMTGIANKVANIEHEVQHNGGGSMKDFLARLESFRRHDFWTKGRPAMEMDGDGQVNLVSEAMCRLLQVSNPEELYRRSWCRFLDGEEVDEFLSVFSLIAKSDSLFRFAIELTGNSGESRGTWEFRSARIAPDVAGKKLYSGHWSPLDVVAREVAARNNWAA